MRYFLVLILLTAMLGRTVYNLGVVGYWATNRAYIASSLCENRSKPELKCDGKCYLKKNLQEEPSAPAEKHQKLPELKIATELFSTAPSVIWTLSTGYSFGKQVCKIPIFNQTLVGSLHAIRLLKPPEMLLSA
jgi:hypothetical protein